MFTKEEAEKRLKTISAEISWLEIKENRSEIDNERIDKLIEDFRKIKDETVVNFPNGALIDTGGNTTDSKSIRMLRNDQKLASGASSSDSDFSMAEFVRSAMGLTENRAALISSPATVSTLVGSQIIDDVRVLSQLIKSGALTIPISGAPVNLARIISDPTVFLHAEGVDDISESVPVFSPVLLKPQTLAAIVPISAEISADSDNLDRALRTSVAAAFAKKLDALGVAKILADPSIPGSVIGENPATWAGVMTAVGSALAENQEIPKALISSAYDFGQRAAAIATGSGMWLSYPPILDGMLDLPTTGLSSGTAIFGDFSRGLCVAMRQDLQLELLKYGKPTSLVHYLMCTMRAEFVVLQPKALYIMGGISS